MEALTREFLSYDWITFFLVFSLLLLAAIKRIHPERFFEYMHAGFNQGLVEIMASEKHRILNPFGFFILVFNSITLSLFLFFCIADQPFSVEESQISFSLIVVLLISYTIGKEVLSYLLRRLILGEYTLQLFMASKRVYFFLFCVAIFVCNALFWYAYPNQTILLYSGVFLLFTMSVYIFMLNKNLIINKLFYFILYICAFEIAPPLLLFKLIFES